MDGPVEEVIRETFARCYSPPDFDSAPPELKAWVESVAYNTLRARSDYWRSEVAKHEALK